MNGVTIDRTPIRSTPGGDIVRSIPGGTPVTFTAELGSWLHVYSVDGQPQGGYINAKSVKVTGDVVVTPPPVTPPTGKRVTNIIDVYSDGTINVKPQ